MAVKSSGPLSLQEIATEFGDTAPHSTSEFYRGGAKVPDAASNSDIPTSGAINIGGFYGAQNRITLNITISSNTNNYNLYTTASANPEYQAGITDINLTVNPGVTVGSSSISTYALSIPSDFNSGDNVTLINEGTIVGKGGNGGNGGNNGGGGSGQTGGNALYVNRTTTITNNGTLAGAGGGGSGSGSAAVQTGTHPKGGGAAYGYYMGNGGGGGAGVNPGSGGTGGPSSTSGNNGSAGTATAGGAGGPRNSTPFGYTGAGGAGGARGSAGSTAENYGGSTTNLRYGPGSAGSAGKYLVGSPYVTWDATGTRLGSAT
jgi:hypothetical protein